MLDYYAVEKQSSIYYYNNYTVLTAVDTTAYTDSTTMFGTEDPHDAKGKAMSLVYSWILWKLPLLVYVFHLTEHQQSKGLRFGTVIAEGLVLLTVDILLTVFALSFYG